MTIRPPSSVAHSNGGAVLCCVHLIECITHASFCQFLPCWLGLVGLRIKLVLWLGLGLACWYWNRLNEHVFWAGYGPRCHQAWQPERVGCLLSVLVIAIHVSVCTRDWILKVCCCYCKCPIWFLYYTCLCAATISDSCHLVAWTGVIGERQFSSSSSSTGSDMLVQFQTVSGRQGEGWGEVNSYQPLASF